MLYFIHFTVKLEPPDKDVEMKEFVKPAPPDADKFKSPAAKSKANSSKKDSQYEEISCATLFGSGNFDTEGELIFFQLPDTLPSYPSTSDDEDRKPVIKQEKDGAGPSHSQHQQQKEVG